MRFDDLAEINPSVPIRKGNIHPFIDMSSLPQHARDVAKIGEKEFKGSGSRFQNGDTLIARITPCLENGKGALVHSLPKGVPGFGSTEFIVARARSEGDKRFVYYLTRSEEFRDIAISRMEGTSGRQRVSWQQIASIEIPDLRPDEREKIGDILGLLDDKIELNRRMAATLEEMARSLYRSWFVDFDPVHAKIEGRQPAFMDEETAALFPDRFGEDGLPEGWERIPTKDIITFTKGRSYKSSELQDSNTALISLKSFQRGGGYRHDGLKAFTGSYKPEQVVCPGELVISLTDVTQAAELIGRATFARGSRSFSTLVASLDVGIIRPINPNMTPHEFLHQAFNSDEFLDHALAHTSGTTVLHLAKDAIPNFKMILPSLPAVTAFQGMCSPMRSRIFKLEVEVETLATLRDTLLPKLMSGEIRVGEAREQIEEVA